MTVWRWHSNAVIRQIARFLRIDRCRTNLLHTHDVAKLITILDRLVEQGNTVIVIEHNLDVVKVADNIIDLGPDGGDRGGTIVAEGTPESVCEVRWSVRRGCRRFCRWNDEKVRWQV